jgi:hypothetical protein
MSHHELVKHIPPGARNILHFGNVDRQLVASLPGANDIAEKGFDPSRSAYYDVVVASDVFEQSDNPHEALRICNMALGPKGILISSFLNAQYGEKLYDLLMGDDVVGERYYTVQGFFRAVLDAGFTPIFMGGEQTYAPPEYLKKIADEQGERGQALTSLMTLLRPTFIAEKLPSVSARDYDGLALLVSTNDERVFRNNIETSEEFNSNKHERFVAKNPANMAEVFHMARNTRKKLMTMIHHDLYIPKDWGRRMWSQFWAEDAKRPVGVAGLFGVNGNRTKGNRHECGNIVDLLGLRTMKYGNLPEDCRVLDGLSLTIKTAGPIRPDPALGFHFYDADVCMQAEERGERVIAVNAPALHSSFVLLPPPVFEDSKKLFVEKWKHRLPVETPCAIVEKPST